jgi:hypothetical protein
MLPRYFQKINNDPELQLRQVYHFSSNQEGIYRQRYIIYIKGTLKAYQIESQETEFIEFIQAGIKTQSGSNILISCIYRSPSANNDDCVRELSDIISIKKFCNTKFDCILHMGDFNFKEINWVDQNTSVGTIHISSKFLEVVRDSFLFQHVKQPTRYRNENTPSLLDLVFTNEKGMIETIDHCSPLGNSDHEILEFRFVHTNVAKPTSDEKIRYFKGDYASVNEILKKVDWDTLLRTGSIDNVWDRFVDKLSIACKDNVPVYKSKPKHYDTPWMDKETLVTVQNKRKKWKKYIYCKSPQNKELYDEAKEDSSKKVRQAQMRYEKEICQKAKNQN